MRSLISVVLLGGGCSLIYNPSNLPEAPVEAGIPIDATVDATVVFDADPNFLALTGVAPALVYEGEGDEGSRPAMVVVTGTQMVPGAKLTITDHATGAAPPGMIIDDAHAVLSDDGKQLAVPVTFPVESALKVNTKRQLDVTVTQMANGAPKSATLSVDDNNLPLLQEQGLAELEDTSTELDTNHNLPSGLHQYSHVKLTKAFGYQDTAKSMQIRAIAGIDIENMTTKVVLSMSASGQNPGPGGNGGGAAGTAGVVGGAGNGGPGSGHGGGQASGGGGSFATPGGAGNGAAGPTTNDPALLDISSSGTIDSGSGGAGSAGGPLLGAPGGVGGGGGGTIELTAGGNLTVQDVHADGGLGVKGGANTYSGSGSGGAILLRTGGALMTATLTAAGAPSGGTGGGKGGDGFIRIDAPTDSGIAGAYAGPMLVSKPLATSDVMITRTPKPMIALHGQPSTTIGIYFRSADGNKVSPLQMYTLGDSGTGSVPLASELNRGFNTLCLVPMKADSSSPAEAQNCYDLVYLFKL